MDVSLVEIIRQNDCLKLKKEIEDKKLSSDIVTVATFSIPNSPKGYVIYTSLTLFHVAAYYDSLESFIFLERYLKRQKKTEEEILSLKTAEGYFPLHYALLSGSYEISQYIIQRAPQQAGLVGDLPIAPLTFAVLGQVPELLELLFQVDKGTITETQVNKAFEMSLLTGNYPCLKILIDKQTSKGTNQSETTAMKAASSFSPETVSLVMKYQANNLAKVFILPTNDGKYESDCLLSRLFHKAKQSNYKPQIMEALKYLDGKVIEPDKPNVQGPCHWMCYLGDVEIARYMCQNFKVQVNRLDQFYQTGPFEMFKDNPNEKNIMEMLVLLKEYEFDFNRIVMENGKLQQKTLLERITFYTLRGREFLKPIQFLLDNGANPDVKCYTNPKRYGTIRDYVNNNRSKQMKELFAKYPKKSEA